MRGVPRARRAISLAPSARHRQAEHARAARDDQFQFGVGVEIQPHRNAEAVAQRLRQKPARVVAPTKRERRQIDLHRARGRSLADDQIELEVLHRGIEDFLDRRIEPVDLVDEQHVARLEIGQKRGEIAGLRDHRPRGGAEIDAELARNDLRQRRLAEARRADEQHVIERFLACARGLDEHREIRARLLLADEVGELLRAQGGINVVLAFVCGDEAFGSGGHVSCRPGQASVSEREPGPIRRSLSNRWGIWVPAFAGTTAPKTCRCSQLTAPTPSAPAGSRSRCRHPRPPRAMPLRSRRPPAAGRSPN